MHSLKLLLVVVLFAPSVAFGAGFAKQSIFLSKTPVTEGETVMIHTVVQNDAAQKFDGNLVVFAQSGNTKEKVGTVAVSIAPGGANTVSISWKPASGSYTVTAELTQADGTVVETQTANFTINKKPVPEALLAQGDNEVESSADVQAMIAKFSPTVANAAQPAFLAIDSLRNQAGKLLNQGIDWSKKTVGPNTNPGAVLGVATEKGTTPNGLMATASFIAAMVALYLFSILKWIIANPAICYPVVAIGFLVAFWKLFSHLRRPRY